jgi:hypothetical protein
VSVDITCDVSRGVALEASATRLSDSDLSAILGNEHLTKGLVSDRGQLDLFYKNIETIIINVLGSPERSNTLTRREANDCGFRVSAQLGHPTVRPMQADPGHFRFHRYRHNIEPMPPSSLEAQSINTWHQCRDCHRVWSLPKVPPFPQPR